MPKALAALVTIIALGVGAYLLFTNRPADTGTLATSTPTQTMGIATTTVSEEADLYKIDVAYPHFGVAEIDASIDTAIQADIAQFKGEAVAIDYLPTAKYEMIGQFDTTTISDQVVSARLVVSRYTGGAHPNATVVGLNFNPKTRIAYSMDDALALIGMDLQQLSGEAKRQLNLDAGDWIQFPEGADPTRENYATYVIGEREVIFYFQQYQVAPYAAGILDISVPRK